MDIVYILQTVVLGIVEGLTEFLPVSSTGHLIVAAGLLQFPAPGKETFIVSIQAGAILAVCWYYRVRLLQVLAGFARPGKQQNLAVNTVLAFLPAAVCGMLFAGFIQSRLFNVFTVAVTLIAGGLIILWVESPKRASSRRPRVLEMDDMSWGDALKVGLMQCFALIPGMSRSGATIIGGMLCGLSRKAATEFSFFLSIPTIIGASAYDLWESRAELADLNLTGLAIGAVISFVAALAVVKWLLGFVSRNNFSGFGWYRIVFGAVVLVAGWCGIA